MTTIAESAGGLLVVAWCARCSDTCTLPRDEVMRDAPNREVAS
jgi:hypothetical protein